MHMNFDRVMFQKAKAPWVKTLAKVGVRHLVVKENALTMLYEVPLGIATVGGPLDS